MHNSLTVGEEGLAVRCSSRESHSQPNVLEDGDQEDNCVLTADNVVTVRVWMKRNIPVCVCVCVGGGAYVCTCEVLVSGHLDYGLEYGLDGLCTETVNDDKAKLGLPLFDNADKVVSQGVHAILLGKHLHQAFNPPVFDTHIPPPPPPGIIHTMHFLTPVLNLEHKRNRIVLYLYQ